MGWRRDEIDSVDYEIVEVTRWLRTVIASISDTALVRLVPASVTKGFVVVEVPDQGYRPDTLRILESVAS